MLSNLFKFRQHLLVTNKSITFWFIVFIEFLQKQELLVLLLLILHEQSCYFLGLLFLDLVLNLFLKNVSSIFLRHMAGLILEA